MAARQRSIIHVHHRGDRGVDGIMRLIELASHDGPLEAMLTAMCDEIAAITGVEVASVYVLEGEATNERLVMRGNHGFPEAAIGTVSLAVGEGITGLAAECMRPVSAAHAATEAAYKHVPGLDEEEFPVFAGVPLISGGAVVGVLVMQRRKKPFAADEVTLATALAAPITLAIERRRATAVRSARLVGTGHGGSVVLGRAGIVPTATAIGALPFASLVAADSERRAGGTDAHVGANKLDDRNPRDRVNGTDAHVGASKLDDRNTRGRASGTDAHVGANKLDDRNPRDRDAIDAHVGANNLDERLEREIERIMGRIRDDLGRAIKKLGDIEDPAIGACLDRFALALVDQRLRERIIAAAGEPSGLRSVAKDYARAATRLASRRPPTAPDAITDLPPHGIPGADGDAADRVSEIEELCALIGMTADARTSARPGSIWLADRVGPVITLAALARGAAALVASDSISPTALAMARAAKLPVISGVPGLFGWARPGDLLAVDGETGTVLVHPAPTEIERLRRSRDAE